MFTPLQLIYFMVFQSIVFFIYIQYFNIVIFTQLLLGLTVCPQIFTLSEHLERLFDCVFTTV